MRGVFPRNRRRAESGPAHAGLCNCAIPQSRSLGAGKRTQLTGAAGREAPPENRWRDPHTPMPISRRLEVAEAFVAWLQAQPPADRCPVTGDRRLEDPRFLALAEVAFHDVVGLLCANDTARASRAMPRFQALTRALATMPGAPPMGPPRTRLRLTVAAIVALGLGDEPLSAIAERFLRPFVTRFDFRTGRPRSDAPA